MCYIIPKIPLKLWVTYNYYHVQPLILFKWYRRKDSNLQQFGSKPNLTANCNTAAYKICFLKPSCIGACHRSRTETYVRILKAFGSLLTVAFSKLKPTNLLFLHTATRISLSVRNTNNRHTAFVCNNKKVCFLTLALYMAKFGWGCKIRTRSNRFRVCFATNYKQSSLINNLSWIIITNIKSRLYFWFSICYICNTYCKYNT